MSTLEHARTSSPASPLLRGLARPALVSAVLFMIVTGIGYPLLTTGVAQVLFRGHASGSLVERNDALVGSSLIGQNFTKPGYFHPRPSATTAPDPKDASQSVAAPYNAALSGASNLAPTSKKLIDQVRERVRAYREENALGNDVQIPVDAVTASASGLDPDISLANAALQARRVAHARGLSEQQVTALIDQHSTPRQFGVLGEPRINVLALNLALDALAQQPSSAR
jgi:K+-transporting ATPase ATPase C chain